MTYDSDKNKRSIYSSNSMTKIKGTKKNSLFVSNVTNWGVEGLETYLTQITSITFRFHPRKNTKKMPHCNRKNKEKKEFKDPKIV